MDNLPIYLPLKMELNEGITRLAHFGKHKKSRLPKWITCHIYILERI